MSKEGDYLRAMADLFDQPEVLNAMLLKVVTEQAQRIEQLEQLCRDMYEDGCYSTSDDHYSRTSWLDDYADRMKELGLLEGEQHD